MVGVLNPKPAKNYDTGGTPMDLLLYFHKDFPAYLPDIQPGAAQLT